MSNPHETSNQVRTSPQFIVLYGLVLGCLVGGLFTVFFIRRAEKSERICKIKSLRLAKNTSVDSDDQLASVDKKHECPKLSMGQKITLFTVLSFVATLRLVVILHEIMNDPNRYDNYYSSTDDNYYNLSTNDNLSAVVVLPTDCGNATRPCRVVSGGESRSTAPVA